MWGFGLMLNLLGHSLEMNSWDPLGKRLGFLFSIVVGPNIRTKEFTQ